MADILYDALDPQFVHLFLERDTKPGMVHNQTEGSLFGDILVWETVVQHRGRVVFGEISDRRGFLIKFIGLGSIDLLGCNAVEGEKEWMALKVGPRNTDLFREARVVG